MKEVIEKKMRDIANEYPFTEEVFPSLKNKSMSERKRFALVFAHKKMCKNIANALEGDELSWKKALINVLHMAHSQGIRAEQLLHKKMDSDNPREKLLACLSLLTKRTREKRNRKDYDDSSIQELIGEIFQHIPPAANHLNHEMIKSLRSSCPIPRISKQNRIHDLF